MRGLMMIAAVAAMGAAPPAQAADPQPIADFTFNRVKAPEPGTKKRILVQIGPSEQWPPVLPEAPVSATPPDEIIEAENTAAPWFWGRVPVAGAGADGLDRALSVLSRPPAGIALPGFRLDTLRKLADVHGTDVLRATVGTRVSPALALAVIAVESSGRSDAVSAAGARGLMQLMPGTAKRFGVADPMVPRDNIEGGVAYLDWLMGKFDADPILVLAGYNAGEGAVARHGGVPLYDETRHYVPKVLAAFQVAKGLCVTPPMLVSDGCVFVRGDRLASRR